MAMKKWTSRLVTASILALVLVATTAMPALADKGALYQAIVAGGDRLLATQGPGSGAIPYNWEWVAGDGYFGNANLQGITASGLLAAFEETGNKAYLTGAKNAGNTLKQRYAAAPNNRPYAQDVEFLVRLSKDSKDRTYLETAKKWYKVVTENFTSEANVARIITARGSLAGWDVAAHIRAADAAGYDKYARDMAEELIRRSADWVNIPYPGTTYDYTTLSYGSLLWALHELGGAHSFQAAIKEYREFLLANQGEDGSWASDYQTTAYAILGLDAVKGAGKDLRDALSSASAFLVTSQASDGGWFYTDDGEYPEVDSECVMALASPAVQEYGRHGQDGQNGDYHQDFHRGHHGHGPRS